ncbi:S4 domain-containing protein, partial [Clostridium perfringens]
MLVKNGTVLKTSRTATSTVLWLQFPSYALNFFFLRSKKKKNKLKKLLGSRAEIKRDCKNGLVKVNGKIENNPGLQVDTDKDIINFDGETIEYKEFIYLMLNKPDGYISATF